MAHHIVPAAEEFIDKQIAVLDHGFVILTDYMGSDAAIARAARVSLAGEGTKVGTNDENTIRYLVNHHHTSPLEMVEMKFICQMPIFVARQWIRRRTASVNEMSGRYGEMPELVYIPEPDQVRAQSTTNKQGRDADLSPEVVSEFRLCYERDAGNVFSNYHAALENNVARETARINLPLSTYTKWCWKIDLHNLLHFLYLRLDEHAQWEIRQYAEVMAKMVEALCPIAWKAFCDYRLHAIRLSAQETMALGHLMARFHLGESISLAGCEAQLSKREVELFRAKLVKLGLGFLNGF